MKSVLKSLVAHRTTETGQEFTVAPAGSAPVIGPSVEVLRAAPRLDLGIDGAAVADDLGPGKPRDPHLIPA